MYLTPPFPILMVLPERRCQRQTVEELTSELRLGCGQDALRQQLLSHP
jgi:hypothetical protein